MKQTTDERDEIIEEYSRFFADAHLDELQVYNIFQASYKVNNDPERIINGLRDMFYRMRLKKNEGNFILKQDNYILKQSESK